MDRERERGDGIHRHCLPPSARYINNDIGVFTSAHASNRVQGRLLYRGGGLRYITHPRRESLHVEQSRTGIDTYWPVRRYRWLGTAIFSFSPSPILTLPACGNRSPASLKRQDCFFSSSMVFTSSLPSQNACLLWRRIDRKR